MRGCFLLNQFRLLTQEEVETLAIKSQNKKKNLIETKFTAQKKNSLEALK